MDPEEVKMILTENAKRLYDILYAGNFSAKRLEEYLQSGACTTDDINAAAFQYIYDCWDDLEEYEAACREPGEVVPGYDSSHMPEAVKILLENGLDPNKKIVTEEDETGQEESNIMSVLRFVENGYNAADTLAILLEHGGDPNLMINGSRLETDAAFDLLFDLYEMPNRFRYDALVHYWMVLVGYGACLENGDPAAAPCHGFDLNGFKNHRDYYYGAIESDRSEDHIEICFFDKRTNVEVARF